MHQHNNGGSVARRKLLRGIVAGGGVAGVTGLSQWTRPVVESVTLPAHAATSVTSTLATTQSAGLARYSMGIRGSMHVPHGENIQYASGSSPSLLDAVIPRAHAQLNIHELPPYGALIGKAGSLYDFYFISRQLATYPDNTACTSETLYIATNLEVGVQQSEVHAQPCTGPAGPSAYDVLLQSVSESQALVVLFGRNVNMTLDPEASPPPPPPPCPCPV